MSSNPTTVKGLREALANCVNTVMYLKEIRGIPDDVWAAIQAWITQSDGIKWNNLNRVDRIFLVELLRCLDTILFENGVLKGLDPNAEAGLRQVADIVVKTIKQLRGIQGDEYNVDEYFSLPQVDAEHDYYQTHPNYYCDVCGGRVRAEESLPLPVLVPERYEQPLIIPGTVRQGAPAEVPLPVIPVGRYESGAAEESLLPQEGASRAEAEVMEGLNVPAAEPSPFSL